MEPYGTIWNNPRSPIPNLLSQYVASLRTPTSTGMQ